MENLSYRMFSLGLLVALILSFAAGTAAVSSRAAQPSQKGSSSVMPGWWTEAPASPHYQGPDNLLDIQPVATWPGPDGFPYYGSTCTYTWVDIAGTGAPVSLSDDDYDGPFPTGFTFPFYGTDYTQFYLSSNGFISFGRGSTDYGNDCPLPDANTPDDIIALMWDDLDPGDTGDLAYYQAFSACPVGVGPCLVVQYENYHHYRYSGGGGLAGTFEAILYEDGAVIMQFEDAGAEEGAESTTGIEGHDAAADYGLTYACKAPGSLSDNLCIQVQRLPGLYLSPDTLEAQGCSGLTQTHTLHLANRTGADGIFDLSYDMAEPAYGTLDGPASLFVPNEMEASLAVTLTSELCLPDGFDLAATVTAASSAYSDTAYITRTVATGGSWQRISDEPNGGRMDNATAVYDGLVWSVTGYGSSADVRTYDPATDAWSTVPGSAPGFGVNHARSGCQIANRVYIYGDSSTSGFTGLWSYDMDANTWTDLTPAGTAPAQTGIWAPAWVHDPEGNLCYMTGGSDSFGPGNLATVYVYDPAADEWLPSLPDFDTRRGFHAAWIVGSGSENMLCVAGGFGLGQGALDSTQCYDFDAGAWNAENADLGELPASTGGMGYAEKLHGGTDEQLWIVGGRDAEGISDRTVYYDVSAGIWQDGGSLPSGAVWGTSATTLNNEIYKLGGSLGGPSAYTGQADRHVQCPVCDQRGWLDGQVYDYDGVNVPCLDATVHIEPGNLGLTLDPTGYYTVPLIPFEYQVSASVPDYPELSGPYLVTVHDDTSTPQDFTLRRPELAVAPISFSASAVAISTVTDHFTITNSGSYTLEYQVREVPPTMVLNAMSRPSGQPGIEVEPDLLAEMSAEGVAAYLIYLRERPDLSPALGMDWQQRGRFVVDALQRAAERSQAGVRAYLDARGVDYKPFWIDNVIVVNSSNQTALNGLMDFPEIEALRARREPILYRPEKSEVASYGPLAVEPNISHVGADQVWGMGITGEDIVVANIDTGVLYTHEALVNQYRGNLGGGAFDHNYNWWDPASGGSDLVPNDYDGHGSHTMGTMLGDDGAGNQIGMAPGATWMACQAFESSDDELLECGQFMAAPWDLAGANPNPDLRPHVVNNSWGDCLQTADHWYDGVIDSWHALGIYPIFSNGNASNCGYPSPPGCRTVGNPARAGNVTGVGSTGRSDGQYATHSNWGPTDDPDTVNPRGSSLKPQVMAPGVDIRSSINRDSVYDSYSGTSMSAPHVVGLIALMWQAAPCLVGDYATTETIIEETATPIPYASGCGGEGPGNVPNHATGWGEIDAVAAVQAARDYCGADWLPWVQIDVVTGTLSASGEQVVEVTFSCDVTATQQTQPLEGTLRLSHNDPCREPVDIDLTFLCAVEDPIPDWRKQVWINGDRASSVVGPHPIRPGDTVVIVDDVRVVFSETVAAVLTETWTQPLDLIGHDTGDVGTATAGTNMLIWDLVDVAPNTSYPITKTFEVQHGDWVTGVITETFWVEDAVLQLDGVVLQFHRAAGIYLPLVLRND